MKMFEIQVDKPFRIIDNQWYNQFIFVRLNDAQIKNLDTDDVGEINKNLEVEYVNEYTPRDPERLKRYYVKTIPQST